MHYSERPNGRASAARHPPERQRSKLMPNSGMIGGRLHAVLGLSGRASALTTYLNPSRQHICRARIR
jgi:hypothetical protein